MNHLRPTIGKFLYAITFLLLIPAGLWLWAQMLEGLVAFPLVQSTAVGLALLIAGGLLMLWAMLMLMQVGKGLPMNAYPPPRFVTSGPYRLVKHPIYWGFGMLVVGCFLYVGLAAGLWFVAPVSLLGMSALVLGYERLDLKRRFPDQEHHTLLAIPVNESSVPDVRDRLSSVFWILGLLLLSNAILGVVLDVPPLLKLDGEGMSLLSDVSLLTLITLPFIVKRKDALRKWVLSGILALGLYVFSILLWRASGGQAVAPSALVNTAVPFFLLFLSVEAVVHRSWAWLAPVSLAVAGILVYALLYLPDSVPALIYSIIVFVIASAHQRIWGFLRSFSEKVANSWQEWTFGRIRVINHGFYIGVGVFLGVLLAGILAGGTYAAALFVFAVTVTICSALWAQLIEGSEKLKRPFGFYGGLVGIAVGSLVVWAMGAEVWVIIGVVSVVMPWVQAMGRLRCLVNGCCHGHQVEDPKIGIRYFHPRSRVCTISKMKGELLHPTPLYSILWLFLVGFVLLAAWQSGLSYAFIFGLYLILSGLGRFVEEAYRGEVQTPNVRGLKLYQWTAIASVAVGILMTLIPVAAVPLQPGFSWEVFLYAGASGLFLFFAMGVDFPYSNARFARLV